MSQDASVQNGDDAHAALRVGNMDTLQRRREIDQISTTKNASLDCPVEKEIQVKSGKKQNIDERPENDEDHAEHKEGQRNSENETD